MSKVICAISPTGLVAVGFSSGTILVHDLDGDFQMFGSTALPANCFAFSPDGQRMAVGASGELQVWEPLKGKMLAKYMGPGRIVGLAFSPQGHLAVGGPNGLYLTMKERWNQMSAFYGQEWVRALAFSPDGQMLVSGGWDDTVKLWRVMDTTLVPVYTLKDTNRVNSVAFSPDGQIFVSGDDDSTVRLWDVSGRPLAAWRDPEADWVVDLSFSPDGLLVGRTQNSIHVWSVDSSGLHLVETCRINEFPQAVAFVGDKIVAVTEKGTILSLTNNRIRVSIPQEVDNAA